MRQRHPGQLEYEARGIYSAVWPRDALNRHVNTFDDPAHALHLRPQRARRPRLRLSELPLPRQSGLTLLQCLPFPRQSGLTLLQSLLLPRQSGFAFLQLQGQLGGVLSGTSVKLALPIELLLQLEHPTVHSA